MLRAIAMLSREHETLIPRSEARRRVGGISRATEHRRLKTEPDWPRPVAIGPGKLGYVQSEIDAYITKKVAARDGRVAK
jgi:predicted DNA-binding transcriptional regulator AlpA